MLHENINMWNVMMFYVLHVLCKLQSCFDQMCSDSKYVVLDDDANLSNSSINAETGSTAPLQRRDTLKDMKDTLTGRSMLNLIHTIDNIITRFYNING